MKRKNKLLIITGPLIACEVTKLTPQEVTDAQMHAIRLGKCEVEVSARRLVEFFKEIGRWQPFHLHEFVSFCQKKCIPPEEQLFGLLCPWFDDALIVGGWKTRPRDYWLIVHMSNGQLAITSYFLEVITGADESAKKKKK